MPFRSHNRQYDLVLFGATGYTGQLTAEYIATHLPTHLKWAVAGRSEHKLREIVEECRTLDPDRTPPAVEICSLDAADVDALSKKAFVLITSVGPYGKYGEHAYKACAENGTHYIDVTGEVAFTARMIEKYGGAARRSGAIMLSQVGIESAPSDLCTWALAKTLREAGAETAAVTFAVNIRGSPSGGTLASALSVFDNFSLKEVVDTHKPFALSPMRNPYRPPRQPKSLLTKLTGLRALPDLGYVTTSIANRTDGPIVERTWGLLASTQSRKQEFYGPKFSFVQYMRVKNWRQSMKIHWGIVVFGFLLATVPPFRKLMRRFVTQPGQGADRDAAKRDMIEYRGVAQPDPDSHLPKKAVCRARFEQGRSLYYFTGVICAEAARTVLEEDLRLEGGAYTPACLGQPYVDNLATGGFKIDTRLVDE